MPAQENTSYLSTTGLFVEEKIGVVGGILGGSCSEITLMGTIKVEGATSLVGGVIGDMYGDLTDIVVNVTPESYVKSSWYTGGVVGMHERGSITNATSNINVISGGAVGGIVGRVSTFDSIRSYINCSSSGIVSYTGEHGDAYVGAGIVGMIVMENTTINFTGCSFTGQVVKAGEVVEGKDIYGYDNGTNDIVIN